MVQIAMDIKDGLSRVVVRNIEFEEVTATAQQQSKTELKQYTCNFKLRSSK